MRKEYDDEDERVVQESFDYLLTFISNLNIYIKQ